LTAHIYEKTAIGGRLSWEVIAYSSKMDMRCQFQLQSLVASTLGRVYH
jgi:hypothetical protein